MPLQKITDTDELRERNKYLSASQNTLSRPIITPTTGAAMLLHCMIPRVRFLQHMTMMHGAS